MKEFENPVIDFLYRFVYCIFGICVILLSAASIYVAPIWVGFKYHWSLGVLTFLFFLCLQIYITARQDEKEKDKEDDDRILYGAGAGPYDFTIQ